MEGNEYEKKNKVILKRIIFIMIIIILLVISFCLNSIIVNYWESTTSVVFDFFLAGSIGYGK